MEFQDKTLTCKDCGKEFVFSAGEQQFYQQKGFANEPTRCPDCRQARKQQQRSEGGHRHNGPRQMFSITCSDCGKESQVPFEPKFSDRPVYCNDCFRRRHNMPQAQDQADQEQMAA